MENETFKKDLATKLKAKKVLKIHQRKKLLVKCKL